MNINEKFIVACENGNLSVVRECIEQGADIHTWNNGAILRAVHYGHLEIAADNGHLKVIKYLIENGANIHVAADQALCWAASNGHLQIINALRKAAGNEYKCHNCIIKSTCLKLCDDFRQY
jgi:ankyrin repeat protein